MYSGVQTLKSLIVIVIIVVVVVGIATGPSTIVSAPPSFPVTGNPHLKLYDFVIQRTQRGRTTDSRTVTQEQTIGTVTKEMGSMATVAIATVSVSVECEGGQPRAVPWEDTYPASKQAE